MKTNITISFTDPMGQTNLVIDRRLLKPKGGRRMPATTKTKKGGYVDKKKAVAKTATKTSPTRVSGVSENE